MVSAFPIRSIKSPLRLLFAKFEHHMAKSGAMQEKRLHKVDFGNKNAGIGCIRVSHVRVKYLPIGSVQKYFSCIQKHNLTKYFFMVE